MKMSGNTVLITGGTRGIGLGLAVALNEHGNRVIFTGRSQSDIDEIISEHPGLSGVVLDATDPASVTLLAGKMRAAFPELNVITANAGISRPESITADDWTGSDAEDIIQTNILGVVRVVAAFMPQLRNQPDAVMMATSSALAFIPLASFPTYCASKAFLHSWLTSLRHQLRNSAVEVLELSPPYMQTALTGSRQSEDPRAMPVDEYVRKVMIKLGQGDHPRGEILLEQDYARRWPERDGHYDAIFAQMNP